MKISKTRASPTRSNVLGMFRTAHLVPGGESLGAGMVTSLLLTLTDTKCKNGRSMEDSAQPTRNRLARGAVGRRKAEREISDLMFRV